MPTRKLIAILLFFLPVPGTTQKFFAFSTWDVDSMVSALPGQTPNERVGTLNRLAASLSFVDYHLSMGYADSAMALAKQLHDEPGMAGAFKSYGYIHQIQGNYQMALQNYFEAHAIYKHRDMEHDLMMVYFDIARAHFFAGNNEKAMEYGNRALEICGDPLNEKGTVGNLREFLNIQGGISQVYVSLEMHEKSIRIRSEILELMNRHQFPAVERLVFTWLIGASYAAKGEPDSAGMFLHKALSFPDENMNMTAQKYRAMLWLGGIKNYIGEKDSAGIYFQQSMEWYDEHGFLFWALNASNLLGNLYFDLNDLDHAEKHYRDSERIFGEIQARDSWFRYDSLKYIAVYGFELYLPLSTTVMKEMTWDNVEWFYYDLFRIYSKRNNAEGALKYHILYKMAGDSLKKIRQEQGTVEIQTRYESEQKERQIEALLEENEFKTYKLKQSRIFLFTFAGFAALVILLAILLIRQNRLREHKNNLILQQKLFRSQMNPHFIFNSLSSIHHFMIHEQPSKAASYLSRFSKLIRSILHSSVEEYTSLDNEIITIENYLELQKMRFPNRFDFSIEVDEALDPENASVPSMITQPFVENAIEHGIKNKAQKGNVSVRFRKTGDNMMIEVEDDGVGRAKAMAFSKQQGKDHTSLATALIRERIAVLNRTLQKKITLRIEDLQDLQGEAAGTKILLEVPLG